MTLSDAQITAIRERAEKATEGPWWWWTNPLGIPKGLHCREPGSDDGYRILSAEDYLLRFGDEDDQEFIAHARTDIPALLSHIEAQALKLEKAREILMKNQEPDDNGVRHFYYCNVCGGNKEIEEALGIIDDTPPDLPQLPRP